MYKLFKKIGEVFTSKFVGTGPLSYKKRIDRAVISQMLRYTVLEGYDMAGLRTFLCGAANLSRI